MEHRLLRSIPFAPALTRAALWTLLEARVVAFRRPKLMRLAEKLAKAHLRRQIDDARLREKLTPDYTIGCKRILVSDDYYPALAQPNVEVVTSGVSEVRARSVVSADGIERPVDTIIFGTGFHVTDSPIASRIRGRDGRTLAQTWTPSMQAYLGTSVAGFPNMFFMLGPNTGLGHNSMIYMIESQLNYIADCLRFMAARGVDIVDVREDVQAAYNEWLEEKLRGTVWTASNCQSWYLDATGRNTTLWPSWTFAYRRRTRRFPARNYVLKRRRVATGGAASTRR
jgi:cation diffusion facilitator CzcD-associated flavoprotein CzcO